MASLNLNFICNQAILQCNSSRVYVKPLNCIPLQQQVSDVDSGIMCDFCNGKGWMLCDFCKGQKTNVRSENNRIYRRCPSCRANTQLRKPPSKKVLRIEEEEPNQRRTQSGTMSAKNPIGSRRGCRATVFVRGRGSDSVDGCGYSGGS
ncbi:hypothetical protein ACS0TY_022903 [Phlomoides rotata]